MKKNGLKKLLSLLLSIAMVFGVVVMSASVAYADDPDWPVLTGFNSDTSTVTWTEGVADGFTSTIVDTKLVNNDALTERSDGGYYIGEITLYVDKLPSGDEVTGNPTATVKLVGTTQDWRQGKTSRSKNFSNITIVKNGDEYATSESVLVGNQACFRCKYHDVENTYFHYKVKLEEKSGTQTGLTLEEVSVSRDSMNNATVKILSNGSGSYYYGLFTEKQDSPSLDTTGDGETLSEGVNNISISSITDNYPRYLYIVGKDDSVTTDPLEIRIPGVAFELQHEIKALEGICSTLNGVPDGNYFYAEKFVDSKGNTITEAAAGDQVTVVFSINGGSFNSEKNKTVGDRIVGEMVEYKLDSWDISGINVDPSPTVTSFEFTMPANDVSVNSVVSIIGQQVTFSSNIKAGEDYSKFIGFNYYSEIYGWKIWLDTIREGENEHIYTFKTGLKMRMRNHIKPGYEYGNYVLNNIDVYNNEVKLDITDETLYDTGFSLQEGDNYKLDFVFRPKAFAFITTTSDDSSMGTASASVDSTTLVYEGETVTLTATPNEGYVLKEWQVKDDNGTTIPYTVDTADPNKASFVMTADYSDEITATAVFEAIPADYSAVDAAIDKANKVDASLYTEESLAVLRAAVEAVIPGKPVTEQAAVDKMAKDIEDAIAALVISPAVDAIEAIEDLPAAEDLTLEDKEDVMAAKEAYDALTDAEKAKVDPLVVKNLDIAVTTIEKLEAEEIVAEQNAAIEALQKQIEELKEQLAKTPGWHTNDDGSKYYCDSQGEKVKGWLSDGGKWYFMDKETGIMTTGWVKDNGKWYFMDKETGIMATGWVKDEGTWYYMNTSGAMQTGWLKDGNTWYYLKSSGAMAANEWCEGYWLNANGSWTYQPKGSWKKNSTGWWFGDTSGWYAKSTVQKIDGVDYTFDAAGYWVQ